MVSIRSFIGLVALSTVLALPVPIARPDSEALSIPTKREVSSELKALADGNEQFRASISSSPQPTLLKQLTDDGQAPPFMFLGCSDSRVSEGTIFNAKPGTLFTQRNIANQFHHTDANTHSVLSYAVAELGVKHVIVMGHYGCGGVAAAIATPPEAPIDAANGAVQNWIDPIRQIFATSTRPEIVELREKNKGKAVVEEPEPQEPGFRALVEENVKAGVNSIVKDSVLANHFALLSKEGGGNKTIEGRSEGGPAVDVFVHGFVYDIENGEIKDLGISVGPPDKPIPEIPFPVINESKPTALAAAVTVNNGSHESKSPRAACEEQCKSKRSLFGHSHAH
ncbi:hypothetical protein HGRIS_011322 [Hohenbuehelia grisea]|uniref:Carbonic anhydrase n=1 Tax=Hohenbuehelia grisea TaxID=104357 RepID=A0ABR3JVJ6_9AGAR